MHTHIKALEYAYKTKAFTRSEAEEAIGLSGNEFDRIVAGAVAHHTPGQPKGISSTDAKWSMGSDALMNYIEYIELQEARKSSADAKILSIIAIGISAFLALASICVSIYQLTSIPTVEVKGYVPLSSEIGILNNTTKISNEILKEINSKTVAPEITTNKPLKATPKDGAP